MASQYPAAPITYAAHGTEMDDTPTHESVHIQHEEDIVAISGTLGTAPQGVHATVAARLAASESGTTRRITSATSAGAVGSITTTATDIGLSVTFTASATRRYRIYAQAEASSTVAGDTLLMLVTDAAGSQRHRATKPVHAATVNETFTTNFEESGISGSITRKVRFQRAAGTGTITAGGSAGERSQLFVDDVGPV